MPSLPLPSNEKTSRCNVSKSRPANCTTKTAVKRRVIGWICGNIILVESGFLNYFTGPRNYPLVVHLRTIIKNYQPHWRGASYFVWDNASNGQEHVKIVLHKVSYSRSSGRGLSRPVHPALKCRQWRRQMKLFYCTEYWLYTQKINFVYSMLCQHFFQTLVQTLTGMCSKPSAPFMWNKSHLATGLFPLCRKILPDTYCQCSKNHLSASSMYVGQIISKSCM